MTNQLIETLQKYTDFPAEEAHFLQDKISLKTVEKDSFFLRQGDRISEVAFIVKGLFRVYCVDYSGSQKTLSFRSEGKFLTGYTPFLKQESVWYSIQALEDAQILSMNIVDFLRLEQRHKCWTVLIKNYITELFMEKEDRERSLLMEDAETRYSGFVHTYPDIQNRVTQYHIASYLGITPSSLSRIRSIR